MLQFRTGMNGRQFLALLNSKSIQVVQFNTKTAAATLALQKQQAPLFFHTKIIRNSSGIASSMPALDVQQEEATAKNEEFPVEKEEDKFDMEQQHKKQVEAENNNSAGKEPIKGQTEFGRKIYTGQNGQRDLKVHYEMGKSGRKFIEIIGFGPTTLHFPKIQVPEDIFCFVRAMDEVLEAVHANKENISEAASPRTLPPNNQQQQKQQSIAAKSQMQSQQQQAMLQQLLQLVLQQQQQLQQMQAANAVRNSNMGNAGFGGVVPKGSEQIILMSDVLAQQEQQKQALTPAAPTMQIDQTALANLLAQFHQPHLAANNNNELSNLMNLLLQNNSGQQN